MDRRSRRRRIRATRAVAGEQSRSGPKWSGARDYTGHLGREVTENLILAVDRARVLANEGRQLKGRAADLGRQVCATSIRARSDSHGRRREPRRPQGSDFGPTAGPALGHAGVV
jgi:hypothetical protein